MSPYRESAERETAPAPTPSSPSSSLIAILLVGFVMILGVVVTRNADRAVARIVMSRGTSGSAP